VNVLESSTWIWYDVAAVTSVQSKVVGCAGVALSAGDSSAGAPGVGGGVAGALTVSVVEALSRSSPEMVTAVLAVTDVVATGNVALVAPPGTVTLAGTLAAAFELNSCTAAPPLGAALCSVAVPVDDVPALTAVGDSVTEMSGGVALAGGLTVSARFATLAPYEADSDTGVVAVTALLVTNANEAVVEPVNTVTSAGSDVNSSG
jgi:hypothetical protein